MGQAVAPLAAAGVVVERGHRPPKCLVHVAPHLAEQLVAPCAQDCVLNPPDYHGEQVLVAEDTLNLVTHVERRDVVGVSEGSKT